MLYCNRDTISKYSIKTYTLAILTSNNSISTLVEKYFVHSIHIRRPWTWTFDYGGRSAPPCPWTIFMMVAMDTADMRNRLTCMIIKWFMYNFSWWNVFPIPRCFWRTFLGPKCEIWLILTFADVTYGRLCSRYLPQSDKSWLVCLMILIKSSRQKKFILLIKF